MSLSLIHGDAISPIGRIPDELLVAIIRLAIECGDDSPFPINDYMKTIQDRVTNEDAEERAMNLRKRAMNFEERVNQQENTVNNFGAVQSYNFAVAPQPNNFAVPLQPNNFAVAPQPNNYFDSLKYLAMQVKYPKAHYPGRLVIHATHWVAINSTCRRIRRVGRELFFQTRTTAITFACADKLCRGELPIIFGSMDHLFVLNGIRAIRLDDAKYLTASLFLQLPKILSGFPKLQKCTLLFTNGESSPSGLGRDASAEILETSAKMPAEMEKLLDRMGVPKHLELDVALIRGLELTVFERALANNVYPLLKFKCGLLAKQEKKE